MPLSSYKVFLHKVIKQGPQATKVCVNITQLFRNLRLPEMSLMNNTQDTGSYFSLTLSTYPSGLGLLWLLCYKSLLKQPEQNNDHS